MSANNLFHPVPVPVSEAERFWTAQPRARRIALDAQPDTGRLTAAYTSYVAKRRPVLAERLAAIGQPAPIIALIVEFAMLDRTEYLKCVTWESCSYDKMSYKVIGWRLWVLGTPAPPAPATRGGRLEFHNTMQIETSCDNPLSYQVRRVEVQPDELDDIAQILGKCRDIAGSTTTYRLRQYLRNVLIWDTARCEDKLATF